MRGARSVIDVGWFAKIHWKVLQGVGPCWADTMIDRLITIPFNSQIVLSSGSFSWDWLYDVDLAAKKIVGDDDADP